MSRLESITIREVESSDLETFFEHQLDPEAIRMADDRESAIVIVLPSGSYTTIARGVNNTVGVGLVEAYNVP